VIRVAHRLIFSVFRLFLVPKAACMSRLAIFDLSVRFSLTVISTCFHSFTVLF
jgi:hypothetical protein